jgi:hypothetical protein
MFQKQALKNNAFSAINAFNALPAFWHSATRFFVPTESRFV